MSYVNYEARGHVGILTINRPEALNALNFDVFSDISKALDGLELSELRCLIITGAGDKSFVAGADIGTMSGFDCEGAVEWGRMGGGVMLRIERLPIPVIAAVNGFALGGGCELAMACDIRLCSENAVFGQPEVGLGIIPGFGGTQRLSRLVGAGMAKYLIYSGLNIKAPEALRIGLVSAVYPQEELLDAALKLANKIASNAPLAVSCAKEAIDRGGEMTVEEGCGLEAELFGKCFGTHDQIEGMACFLSKEKPRPKPVFTGN